MTKSDIRGSSLGYYSIVSRFDDRLDLIVIHCQEACLAESPESKVRKRQEGMGRNDRARSRCTGNVVSDSGSRAT